MIRQAVWGATAALGVLAAFAGASMAGDDRGRSVSPDQCVSRPFDTTKVIDERTLFVDDRSGRAVLLHMTSACLSDRHEAIGMKFTGGSSRICGPLDVDVTGSVVRMPSACMISSVEALTKEQAKIYKFDR